MSTNTMPTNTMPTPTMLVTSDRAPHPAGASISDQSARPRARLEAADTIGVAAIPTEHLEAEIIGLARRLAAGTYELLALVGEYDARGTWALHGALSCARWLAELCDVEVSTARSQVRVARALRDHPLLDAAMRDGDLSYAKARVLVPWLTEANVEPLVAIAVTTPAGRLGVAIAAWSQRNDDQGQIERHHHDSRACTWRTEPDGMVTLTARLTPAAAGAVCAVIDTQVTRAAADRPEGSDAVDAPAGAPIPARRHPTLAQQRADALVAVVTQPGEHQGGVDAEVIVHVTGDGNHLPDGTPLSDHAVTAMLPDAFVSLLVHDAERRPIDASPRRRFPTRRQRRVLDARHDQCQHPGCGVRDFLQYDHILPFAEGGLTTVANLQRLCGPHNRAKPSAGTSARTSSTSTTREPDAA